MTKLGATGEFPDGKLNPDDEGELTFGIAYDPQTNMIHINFGKPVQWMAMPPEIAIEFGKLLIDRGTNLDGVLPPSPAETAED